MKRRTYVCTIESASEGTMIIWLGSRKIVATCNSIMQDGKTRLAGTVRTGPTSWQNRNIEVVTYDNENGTVQLAA